MMIYAFVNTALFIEISLQLLVLGIKELQDFHYLSQYIQLEFSVCNKVKTRDFVQP